MSNKRPLLKVDIERAYAHSKSAFAAARYLNVSYLTFKKYATLYGVFKTNQRGEGIPKIRNKGAVGLQEILSGKHPNYSIRRLKERLIHSGMLSKECHLCGFKEERPNGKVPLSLYFKDGNGKNFDIGNLELRCFNCMYLTTGKIDPYLFKSPSTLQRDVMEQLPEDVNIEEIQNEAMKEMDNEN